MAKSTGRGGPIQRQMSQGKAVDYGIASPAHMSTFAKSALVASCTGEVWTMKL